MLCLLFFPHDGALEAASEIPVQHLHCHPFSKCDPSEVFCGEQPGTALALKNRESCVFVKYKSITARRVLSLSLFNERLLLLWDYR